MKSEGFLRINFCDISYLGGPVSFGILEPTIELKSRGLKPSPLLLLGDHHNECGKEECNITKEARRTKNKKNIVHTNTPLWFRCLDLYGTYDRPVQYYIESPYFDTKMLSGPYYFQPQVSKWTTNTSNHSYMTYIWKYHPNCFAPKYSKFYSQCITQYIKYNLIELRQSSEIYNFKDSHKSILKEQHKLLITSNKKVKYKYGKSYETLKKLTSVFKSNNSTSTLSNIDTTYTTYKTDSTVSPLPIYENQLYYYFHDYKVMLFEIDFWKICNINPIKILEYFQLGEYKKCAMILFNVENSYIVKNSKLVKTILQLNKNSKWAWNCFLDYFEFSCKMQVTNKSNYLLENSNNNTIVKEYLIDRQAIIDHSMFTMYMRDGVEPSFQMIEDINKKYLKGELLYKQKKHLYNDIYNKYCLLISTIFLTPINDMVMWLQSITIDTPLTVYNAGNAHIVGLFYFLVTRGYYNPVTELLGYDLFKTNLIDSHCISFT